MFAPWSRVIVRYYTNRREWHERLVVLHISDSHYLILTPDGDLYAEALSVPPMVRVRRLTELGDGSREVPEGIRVDEIYWFEDGSAVLAPLTEAIEARVVGEALEYLPTVRLELGPLRTSLSPLY